MKLLQGTLLSFAPALTGNLFTSRVYEHSSDRSGMLIQPTGGHPASCAPVWQEAKMS